MNKKNAVVLLSGGQDSSTCLFWAKKEFQEVVAIGFDYGQKHVRELTQARKIASLVGVDYKIFDIRNLLGESSLTNHSLNHNQQSPRDENLPASFTPGRNILFLSLAGSFAYEKGFGNIVTGACQTDYSGYPDCRFDFIQQMEVTLNYGLFDDRDVNYGEPALKIHTPLMYKTKAETFKLAKDLDVLDIIIKETVTDYNGDSTENEWGMGVENNPASVIRAKGFQEAKEKGWI